MVKKKSKRKGKKLSARELKSQIIRLFKANPKKRLNAKQVIQKLKISNSKDAVQDALEKLSKEKILYGFDDLRYKLDKFGNSSSSRSVKTSTAQGTVDMTRTGAAYIVCDNIEDDVYVPEKYMNSAMNGDKVELSIHIPRGRRKPEGKVLKVISRANEYFMGTLRISRKYGIVTPDNSRMPMDIFVDLDDLKEANDGEKVVVKITKWPSNAKKNPIGIVSTVLGALGSNDIEMNAILINNGFNLEFPEEVIAESEALSEKMSEEEIAKRRDMRGITTFTIDPDTAKDFDDALSIQQYENGDWEIGVHIADVSHYVKPDTALDKEAFKRSTSVYLVDRVLPMLPEKLSNGVCSLRPHEEKFTFSAIFTFNDKLEITKKWFGKTIIYSDHRFSYEEAQEGLETKAGPYAQELAMLNKIALKLRKQKFKNGAIAFEAEEVKFRLDENGVPIDVYVKERKEAHMLIEDFMLLANKEVAKYINKKADGHEIPFVYRVHDSPDPDKIADFARFAMELGYKMDMQTPQQIADSFNNLAKAAKKDSTLKILEPLAIRTMSKAIYTTENIGHYGLGFDFYSHFTSPIRRYSDVLAHRILEKNLKGTYRVNKDELEEKCKHISSQERKAMDAERESIKYKQVEFIEKHIGEEFEGVISGMIDRGIFVELKANKCEGMVGFDTMNEPFDIADDRLSAKSLRSNKVLKMGDTIRVKILSADLVRKQIEMEIVE